MDVLQEADGGLAAADARPRVKGRAGRPLGTEATEQFALLWTNRRRYKIAMVIGSLRQGLIRGIAFSLVLAGALSLLPGIRQSAHLAAAQVDGGSGKLTEAPPYLPPDERFKADILVIVAHPDDETEVTGYLARAIFDEHKRVAAIFGTPGNGGGDVVSNAQAAALGEIRSTEARDALASFGVLHVWFLGGSGYAWSGRAAFARNLEPRQRPVAGGAPGTPHSAGSDPDVAPGLRGRRKSRRPSGGGRDRHGGLRHGRRSYSVSGAALPHRAIARASAISPKAFNPGRRRSSITSATPISTDFLTGKGPEYSTDRRVT